MYEMEIKIKLKNYEDYVKKLRNLNASYVCDLIHIDKYYNMPENTRDFKETDEALRLRRVSEFKARSDPINFEWFPIEELNSPRNNFKTKEFSEITYKGSKIDTKTKSRIEHNCKIDDFNQMDLIFTALGFRPVITVKKQRVVLHMVVDSEDVEILLDKIEYLDGFYSELEIMVASKEDIPRARNNLFALLKELGYGENDSITVSYLELVLDALKNKN